MQILNVLVLSLVAGLATVIGGALVMAFGKPSMRVYDGLLGFAAGVMTAIATLGLVAEAMEVGSIWMVLAGISTGAGMLFLFDRYLPHEHIPTSCSDMVSYRRGVLIWTAITLHNIPEGLAIGTSFAAQPRLGLLLALAIALHNIPEGIVIAGPFRACGFSRRRSLTWTLVSGLAEPLGALAGAVFVTLFTPLLPFSLAFAGGAMLYVVSDELIPESHSRGHEHQATFGFISGLLLMVVLLWMLK
jgi:ZIP family zinc transporter